MARTTQIEIPTIPDSTPATLYYLATSEESRSPFMYLQSIK